MISTISPFAVYKLPADRVRAKWPISVVSDVMVIALASSISWNSLREV